MLPSHHPSPHVFAVDRDRFQSDVLDASARYPVLVDFWADWCGPCHALAPHLSRVVDESSGSLRLAKVEVDEGDNMKLAGYYRLRGFPTVILFMDGQERGRFSGSRSSHQIRDWLHEHLGMEITTPDAASGRGRRGAQASCRNREAAAGPQ